MRKTKSEIKCECGGETILFGKTKDGRQKYHCKVCGAVFTKMKHFTSGRKGKRLLSLLFNIISKDFYKRFDLNSIFDIAIQKTPKNLDAIYFSTACNKADGNVSIKCNNPKLLICETDNGMILYKIPENKTQEKRTISIIDDKSFPIDPEKNYHYQRYRTRTNSDL